MNASKPSGFFADYYAARVTAGKLRELPFLAPGELGKWSQNYNEDLIANLQQVENIAAAAEGRPAERVFGYEGAMDERGRYCWRSKWWGQKQGIYINVAHPAFRDPSQAVETILHEGRHAYQAHAIRTPGFHPDPDEVALWRKNRKNYMRLDRDGASRYMTQPVEHDAGAVGRGIAEVADLKQALSRCEITRHNQTNGLNRLGFLKPQASFRGDPGSFRAKVSSEATPPSVKSRKGAVTRSLSRVFAKRCQKASLVRKDAQVSQLRSQSRKIS